VLRSQIGRHEHPSTKTEEVEHECRSKTFREELPIACGLSDLAQRKRREELSRQLFSGCQRTDELDDGYEFVFPGGPEWAEKLVRFVASERVCCPFFGFEMIFESGQGPISLRVRGPEGTKEFVREEFLGG
jgi:hypothetical protein